MNPRLNRVAALAMIIALSATAHATGTPPPPPPPAPSPAPQLQGQAQGQLQGQAQQQGQAANLDSSQRMRSDQNQRATGTGTGTGVGEASSNLNQGDSSYASKALAIAMPTLAFTPPLPMTTCPTAEVKQDAFGLGFGVVSKASSSSSGKACYAIIMYNDFLANCQYESARRFKHEMAVELYPNFKTARYSADDGEMFDLSPTKCHDLKKPVVAPVINNYISNYTIPPAAPASAPAVVKGKPAIKKAPPCPVGEKSTRVCKPVGKPLI